MCKTSLQGMSYLAHLSYVPTIERSVLGGIVNWDLKMMSPLKRCPPESVRYMEVLLWDRHFIRSSEKCPL